MKLALTRGTFVAKIVVPTYRPKATVRVGQTAVKLNL